MRGFSISGGIDLALGLFGGALLVWGLFFNGGLGPAAVGTLMILAGIWTVVNK